MPKPQDLADLFNFEFNSEGSVLIHSSHQGESRTKWKNKTQSNYLFFEKFGGKEGLIKQLNSEFPDEADKKGDKWEENIGIIDSEDEERHR